MFSTSTSRPLDLSTLALAPKVLLHDHLDGGLRPSTVLELATEVGYDDLPATDADSLARWFREAADSGSLERYLETFAHTVAVMQTASALERVARECVEDLAADGVVYAEIRYAPEQHLERGLTLDEVVEAMRQLEAENADLKAKLEAANRRLRNLASEATELDAQAARQAEARRAQSVLSSRGRRVEDSMTRVPSARVRTATAMPSAGSRPQKVSPGSRSSSADAVTAPASGKTSRAVFQWMGTWPRCPRDIGTGALAARSSSSTASSRVVCSTIPACPVVGNAPPIPEVECR